MGPERLDNKLLIQKCPHRFATTETRPPLLSSATRLSNPRCFRDARLPGTKAQPPFGTTLYSYSFSTQSFSGPTTYNKSTD
jgi:hypothetical protein